jgi:hypothetical protein
LALVLKGLARFKPIKPNRQASFLRVIFEICATYGAIVSVAGFVIQFTGLRGMHWSATIAQLIAMLIMVALRAWVRRNLAYRPSDQEVTQGHELDWLAVRMAGNLAQQQRLWSNPSATHSAEVDHTDDFWTVHCWSWSRIPGCGSDSYKILNPSSTTAGPEKPTPSAADKVVRVRQRLGILSKWTSRVSEPAVAVAKAIEMVMDTLWDPAPFAGDVLFSTMDASIGGENQPIFFKLKRTTHGWTADATEIEVALSLWLYYIEDNERKQGTVMTVEVLRETREGKTINEHDWLRHGRAALRKDNIRLLGVKTTSSLRDLKWYLGSRTDIVSVVSILSGVPVDGSDDPSQEEKDGHSAATDIVEIDKDRIVGVAGSKSQLRCASRTTMFKRRDLSAEDFALEKESNSRESQTPTTDEEASNALNSAEYLAVRSDTPLEVLLAQEMFHAFMCAISKRINRIGGQTILQASDGESAVMNLEGVKLENSKLLKITQEFERVGLGSPEEALVLLIPPLSSQGKLPPPWPVVDHMQDIAERLERAGHWITAGDVYLSLFRLGKSFGNLDPIASKTTALLSEFHSIVHSAALVSGIQDRDDSGEMRDLRKRLLEALNTPDPSIRGIRDTLRKLYTVQGRDENGIHQDSVVPLGDIEAAIEYFEKYATYSNFNHLHRKAVIGRWLPAHPWVDATSLRHRPCERQ